MQDHDNMNESSDLFRFTQLIINGSCFAFLIFFNHSFSHTHFRLSKKVCQASFCHIKAPSLPLFKFLHSPFSEGRLAYVFPG